MSKTLFYLVFTVVCFSYVQTVSADEGLSLPKLTPSEALIGSWKYSGNIYRGQEIPPPNPDLLLLFEFRADGSNRLFWSRANEPGFCERLGRFTATNTEVIDIVTWVNPKNASECSRDSDMQMGRKAQFSYKITTRLEIELNLGNETISYLWEKVP